jgi:hypothetical protein
VDDPTAMLCSDPDCRCGAALQQRLATLTESPPSTLSTRSASPRSAAH